jgi:hypothetical protein
VARGEVVGAIEDHIGARDRGEILQPLVDRDDGDVGIDGIQRRARRVDLYGADRLGAIEDLALQVGEVDLVGVDEREAPDAGRREIERRRAAEAAGADDQRVRRAQLLLPLDADLGEQDMAAVP